LILGPKHLILVNYYKEFRLKQLDCEIETISFEEPIDSSNMNRANGRAKHSRVNYLDFDGFVVHGSDTMSYSASALSFMLENLSKPVIFTGSQLPIGFAYRCQRKFNYRYSNCFFARKWVAVITEVCLYFEYKLYRGNRTTKINAEHFKAFTSIILLW
jgi:L-asparaginase